VATDAVGMGEESGLIVCNTICPAEYVVQAREIALQHMQEVETAVDDRIDQMLTVGLRPLGGLGAVTHYLCVREVYRQQVEAEVATLCGEHRGGLSWCADRELTMQDDPEFVRMFFGCIVGETNEVLQRLGLEQAE